MQDFFLWRRRQFQAEVCGAGNNKTFFMPEEKQNARMYFIAVVLPQHLDEKIRAYKTWMHEMYGSKVGLKSPAHITIAAPFWMEAYKEARLAGDIKSLAQTVSEFSLATADFSVFEPKTIFIALAPSEPLHQLKKTSDHFFLPTNYKIKPEARPFHPHITIATRDLHKKDFAEAWCHFKNKLFRETFIASGLSLLKHNGRIWEVVFTAPFQKNETMDFPAPR